MLEDFLENHQYNEAAYNRYVYSGSTAEQDDSDISSHDASSSNNDEYHANEDQDTEAEYVLRIREPSEDETIAADMLAQLQTRTEFGISSVITGEGNPSPVITRSPDHSLSVSPPVFFNIYTESVRSPTAEQSVGLQEGLDNSDEDSTTTDEYVDMRYVIEASD